MKTGTKILTINELYFLLPEKFKGSLSHALRILADYHESQESKDKREVVKRENLEEKDTWIHFLEIIEKGGKVVMYPNIFELSEEKGWETTKRFEKEDMSVS